MNVRHIALGAGAAVLAAAVVVATVQPVRHFVRWNVNYYSSYLAQPPMAPAERGGGGPADGVLLHHPGGIAEDADGRIYVSDRGKKAQGSVVWRIDQDRAAHAIAGTGASSDTIDSFDKWLGNEAFREPVPALEADFGVAEGLALYIAGGLAIADSGNHLVLRLDGNGHLGLIAGTGKPGFAGDGGPATQAQLNKPYDVKIDSGGNLYVADAANHRIRRISPDGIITTVAGTGVAGYAGDGGPAAEASLNLPYNLWIDERDRIFIGDSENHVVRMIGTDGTITTVAGSGERGYSGDGGPAMAARMDGPQPVAVAADGTLYIGDEHNHAIRAVSQDGIIRTVVGTGRPGRGETGMAATETALNDPEGILIRPDGSLLVLDSGNGRVLSVGADGRAYRFAGRERASE